HHHSYRIYTRALHCPRRYSNAETEVSNARIGDRKMSADIALAEYHLYGADLGCRHRTVRREVSIHFVKAAHKIRAAQRNQRDGMSTGDEGIYQLGEVSWQCQIAPVGGYRRECHHYNLVA